MSDVLTTAEAVRFLGRQLASWPMARRNFDALAACETKNMLCGGRVFTLQHNPARIASTGADVSKSVLAQRRCFLCGGNRPAEQLVMAVDGKNVEGLVHRYEFLVNPFPIFPVHFTIAAPEHVPQRIVSGADASRFADMVCMARCLPGLALFYNGATCGASAPDHFHFQAVEADRLPLLDWVGDGAPLPYYVCSADFATTGDALKWIDSLFGREERPVNILVSAVELDRVRVVVIPRRAHRPDFYGTGKGQVLVSPASVDLAGTVILPRPEDFHENFTSEKLEEMLRQTCFQADA